MGHLDFGTMQRLNIEAARKHAGQSELVTPGPPTGGGGGGGNGGGVTPISLNTPDILNSLLNINPFFETPTTVTSSFGASSTFSSCSESLAGTPEDHEKKVFATLETPLSSLAGTPSSSAAATSSSTSTLVTNPLGGGFQSTSTGSSLLPLSIPPPSSQPPSVELMRSKLIKEGLKHSIQSKRKSSGKGELDVTAELVVKQRKKEEVQASKNKNSTTSASTSSSSSSAFLSLCYHPSPSSSSASATPDFLAIQSDVDYSSVELPYKLTPEDEERRRRRRERNKIAATKCRNKKKEKTQLLIQESESLEGNNISLKSEISKLEAEQQQLMDALAAHAPHCSRVLGSNSNISSDSRGGTSGGGGGNGGGTGSRNLASTHSMISPQFSTGHHQSVSGCYSTGQTHHHSQIHGGGGLPHHHHNNYLYNNASIQLS